MTVGRMILRLGFSGGAQIDTDRFAILSAQPELVRKIGTRISREQIISAYSDPVWKMRLRVGPVLAAEGAMLRGAVGSFISLRFDDTAGLDRPAADIWIGPTITAELIDVRQRRLGADITRGERFELHFQFLESRIGAT